MSKSTKGGNVVLNSVRTKKSVRPGEDFEVEVDVSNGATYIGPLDPDGCGDPANGCTKTPVVESAGYCVNIEFYVNGEKIAESGNDCLHAGLVGAPTGSKTWVVTAPEAEGKIEVGANVVLDGSGKETGVVNKTVNVTGSEPTEAPTRDPSLDNPLGGGGNGNGNGGITSMIIQNPVKSAVAAGAIGAALQLMPE